MVLEYVPTSDGWNLAAYRYLPAAPKRYPVILIHGLGTNRFDFDFPDPKLSFAKYLYRRGYDTWVIELRGSGKSHRKGSQPWVFDDHVFKDIPALATYIGKKTKKKKFHWIGHSLGGTLVYAAVETMGNKVCASAVTLGAAMSSIAKPGFIKFLLKLDPLYKRVPYLPLKRLAQWGGAFSKWLAPVEDNFYYASGNMEEKTIKMALKVAIENISCPLFLQLHGWYKDNHFRSLDGSFSYRDHLKKIRAPFLVCAGSVDGLTPYPDVHFGFREIGSKEKKFKVFGREEGCRTEYAHLDLILGKNARKEVFPKIIRWLDKYDGK